MASVDQGGACQTVRCADCALRRLPIFKPVTPSELQFIERMKTADEKLAAGATIIAPGATTAELYTLYSGWAFRYKMLSDNRRQILSFLLPGDLIGLQPAMFDAVQHGVEALTPVHLCVMPRRGVWPLYREMPELAFDVTWLGARSEALVDESLLSAGRRTADERVAALLIGLFKRARSLGMTEGNDVDLPLTQQHLADALGLSLVHTNKTLAKLRRYGLYSRSGSRFTMLNLKALQRLSELVDADLAPRPLI
jgi:CRP-like cAMP-binding protein